MRTNKKSKQILAQAALVLLFLQPAKIAVAEGDSGPMLDQLTRAYRLASPAIETDGSSTFAAGTLLLVQRPGVIGYDHANIALEEMCPARLEAGQLNPPRSVLCNVPARQSRKAFPVSDPVCVTAFRLSEENDRLSIYLIECGAGARIHTDRTFYALLEIQLPKGALKSGSLGLVQSEIGKVLAPKPPDAAHSDATPPNAAASDAMPSAAAQPKPAAAEPKSEQTAPPLAPQPTATPASQPAPGPAASAEPQRLPPPLPPLPQAGAAETQTPAAPTPATDSTSGPAPDPVPAPAASRPAGSTAPAVPVSIGQTVDQVEAILGAPSTADEADGKLVYIYSHRFKIVFLKGKVTEINPLDNSQ